MVWGVLGCFNGPLNMCKAEFIGIQNMVTVA